MKKKYRGIGAIAIALSAAFIAIQGVGSVIEGNATPTSMTRYSYNLIQQGVNAVTYDNDAGTTTGIGNGGDADTSEIGRAHV